MHLVDTVDVAPLEEIVVESGITPYPNVTHIGGHRDDSPPVDVPAHPATARGAQVIVRGHRR